MSVTLTGVKSNVVIRAARLGAAIKEETGVVLKLSDEDYNQRLDETMQMIENKETIALYEYLTGKKLVKCSTPATKSPSTIELIMSNLNHRKLLAIFQHAD